MKIKDYFDEISRYDVKIQQQTEELSQSKAEFYNGMISDEKELILNRLERLRNYNNLLSSLSSSASDEANDFTIKNAKQLVKKFGKALNHLENSEAQLEDIYKILIYSKGVSYELDPFTSHEESERRYLVEGMNKVLDESEKLWVEKGFDIADELSLFQSEREA